MKTKNSNSAPRDSTQGEIRYLNYSLEFPDGEIWTDYTHVAGGLDSFITRTNLHVLNPDAARALVKKGEYHWYASHGALGRVRHHMKLSNEKCEQNWGSKRIIKGIN